MSRRRLRVLVTNDDGVFSESLEGVVGVLSEFGEVLVIVPEHERSAVSHAITLHKPLRLRRVRLGGLEIFVSNGTPADCVLLARSGVLGFQPDLVVSGVNRGPNLGIDAVYSGTVAAAREGAVGGIPSLAVSMGAMEEPLYYESACRFLERFVGQLAVEETFRERWFPEHTFLNVNVPNVPWEEIRGARITRPGRRRYVDSVQVREDPRGTRYYWVAAERVEWDAAPETDSGALMEQFISVSPIPVEIRIGELLDRFRPLETDLRRLFRPEAGRS